MGQSQSAIEQTYDVSMTEDEPNAWLYEALKKEKTSDVVELCGDSEKYPDGPLHVLTKTSDTVLHMAAYTVQADLVIELLGMLTGDQHRKLIFQNSVGNTVLREAAAFNKLVPAAEKMLKMAPQLLSMRNKFEETALFRAAYYGKIEMLTILDREVCESCPSKEERTTTFYKKENNSTILHTAIISGQFKLALRIAKRCDYLVGERDEFGLTALQYLACSSLAFKARNVGHLKRLLYKRVPVKEDSTPVLQEEYDAGGWRVPLWEEIKQEKLTYEFAKELAKILVKKDAPSWDKTKHVEESSQNSSDKTRHVEESSQNHGRWPSSAPIQGKEIRNVVEAPLFLAIKVGCVDIVIHILNLNPQAVEFVDGDGCTILHFAIKYRQLEIFDRLEKMGPPITKLMLKRDYHSNSILHMVGEKKEDSMVFEKTKRNPLIQLHQDLLFFERVKNMLSIYSINLNLLRNSEGQTAEERFVENKEDLRTEATQWLKGTAQNCSINALLNAATAFTAAYTVPGGFDQQTGYLILLNQHFFHVFLIADTLSLTCAFISIVVFLSILTSPFRFSDFKHSLPRKLVLGLIILVIAVTMLTLAFAASIFLLIRRMSDGQELAQVLSPSSHSPSCQLH